VRSNPRDPAGHRQACRGTPVPLCYLIVYPQVETVPATAHRQSTNVTMSDCAHTGLATIGWREWLSLPELGIPHLKAKVDTGARTSALHACYVEPFRARGVRMVRFGIHPLQRRTDIVIECTAAVIDRRDVTDSGGHREMRYVIETPATLGNVTWPVELTLTNRDTMRFRMLLGRTAMEDRFVVIPSASYLLGRRPPRGRPAARGPR
jgi:hypothetical protein